jgi:hypothetical protein
MLRFAFPAAMAWGLAVLPAAGAEPPAHRAAGSPAPVAKAVYTRNFGPTTVGPEVRTAVAVADEAYRLDLVGCRHFGAGWAYGGYGPAYGYYAYRPWYSYHRPWYAYRPYASAFSPGWGYGWYPYRPYYHSFYAPRYLGCYYW